MAADTHGTRAPIRLHERPSRLTARAPSNPYELAEGTGTSGKSRSRILPGGEHLRLERQVLFASVLGVGVVELETPGCAEGSGLRPARTAEVAGVLVVELSFDRQACLTGSVGVFRVRESVSVVGT